MTKAETMRAVTENGASNDVMATIIYAAANLRKHSCVFGFISKKDVESLREAGYTVEFDEWHCCKVSW